ncbi:MAG: translation initiation factor IF-1 [Candidatus Shikimatogenerans sp. Tder]|uniref:Translation initiation factor IF-1 n=1 Tax=Candidatus Shikimatogenerans sp. Tder TaxID=3158566 RepID=A0AAU7QTA2_9FLAO
MKQENLIFKGKILQSLSNNFYKIKLFKNNKIVLGYLCGKMRKNYIRVLPGDKVKLEFSIYDKNRCIIKYRY